jgi:hypothetical protein
MRRLTRVGLVVAVLAGTCTLAATATKAGATDSGLLNASPESSWQTNAPGRSVAYGNGVVFVGGDFTAIRPPAAVPGSGEVPALHLTAFDANDGTPIAGFSASVTSTTSTPATVYGISLSADGSTLYFGGRFTTVDGVTRTDVAAVNAQTGALLPWAPKLPATSTVFAVTAISSGTVYLGGQFSTVNGSPRGNAASVSASAKVLPWNPTFNGPVHTIMLSPDGTEVVVGGNYGTADGVTHRSIIAVDPASGALNPAWGTGPSMSNLFQVWHMSGDANQLYIGGVDFGGDQGFREFDGTAALNWATGTVAWSDYCQGDTHAVAVINNVLYIGSHAHDCSSVPGGFPVLTTHQDLTAEDATTGTMLNWFPNDNASGNEATGSAASTSDGTQLFDVGDFTKVNGKWQQGFVRFGPTGDGAPPTTPTPPTAQANPDNTVTVEQQTSTDIDDGTLTYTLLRDGKTVVDSVSQSSRFWNEPIVTLVDTSAHVGRHTYNVSVTDGVNTVKSRPSNAVFVGGTAPTTWSSAVGQAGPIAWWRLGESNPSAGALDSTFRTSGALYEGGVSFGTPGAITGDPDTAVTLDGNSGYVTSRVATPDPEVFSASIWFNTTSTSGGVLFGFGDRQTGQSSNYDRHVYMTNSGHLDWGVWTGSAQMVTSANSYNDGLWHQVVATLGPNGMTLYVDGVLVGTNPNTQAQQFIGFWRVGYDNLNFWPDQPSSFAFGGSLDDFTNFQYQLSGDQVAQLYNSTLGH